MLHSPDRPRVHEFGVRLGELEPGPLNAITDVAGVLGRMRAAVAETRGT